MAVFAKGKSGNPAGISRVEKAQLDEVRGLAREMSGPAIRRLAELMTAADSDAVCKAACDSILDRALGKPQTADVGAAEVRAEMAAVFGKLRERLSPEVYKLMLEAVASEGEE